MYCGQCGKKVMENMLFCPFCGSPIVIPEQDAAAAAEQAENAAEARLSASAAQSADAAEASAQRAEPQPEPARADAAASQPENVAPTSLFDNPNLFADAPTVSEEEFQPLRFDTEDEVRPLFLEAEEEADAETATKAPEPPHRSPRSLAPQGADGRKRSPQTFIPVKDVDMENMFFDDEADDAYDAYDADEYDADDTYDAEDFPRGAGAFEFEERERGGFFERHMRGVVALILCLVLIAVCGIWACMDSGQAALAKVNLAWSAEAYAKLGHEAYKQGSNLLAARYFEKALAHDGANYEYAHNAMVAYYDAENVESAAAMLKKCIAMDPNNVEPYQELLLIYPDAATRPWEIQQLIRDGYVRTGDATLKQADNT